MTRERELTGALGAFFGHARGVVVGIGDDAAVVRNPARESVLCCDPVVEGVHFRADTPPALVGRKVVNRNLSDLAAMGAVPDWLLLSLVLPRGYPERRLWALLAGVRAAARAGKCTVIGGDVAAGRGPLVATVTAVGHPAGRILRRDAARPGDRLHLTGPIGGSSLGSHLTFRPHLREGIWLAQRARGVHAAIDVSDGLLLDLHTMLVASGGPGAELDANAIPLTTAALRRVHSDRAGALSSALGEGEDHVLLFTDRGRGLPAGGPLSARARRPIGRVVREPGLRLRHRDGTIEELRPEGWQHEF
jgi:thiamine-monophosphate kinase